MGKVLKVLGFVKHNTKIFSFTVWVRIVAPYDMPLLSKLQNYSLSALKHFGKSKMRGRV